MRQLFLHVGTGKTGTSAIQDCLEKNQAALYSRGVKYPSHSDLAAPGADIVSSGNGGPLRHFLVPEWRNGKLDEERFLQKLANNFSGKTHSVVISNETLEYGSAEKFIQLTKFCEQAEIELKVIYFARDIAAHALSAWSQITCHHGSILSWEDFLVEYSVRINMFEKSLNKFSSFLPPEAIVVQNYSSISSKVLEIFFSIIGEDYNQYEPGHQINPSSRPEIVTMMLKYNRSIAAMLGGPSDRPGLNGVFFSAAHRQFVSEPLSKFTMSLDSVEYAFLQNKLQPSLDRINSTYLSDDPIKIAAAEEIGASLRVPKLDQSSQQTIWSAAEFIVSESHISGPKPHLASQLDEMLQCIRFLTD